MRTITERGPTALLPIAVALALVLAGCGGDTTETPTETAEAAGGTGTSTMDDMEDMDDHDESFTFGEPADVADADRTVQIEASDALTFDPDEITVSAGEVVAFEVTNTGQADHEFVLGPADVQDEHEAEMADMGDEAMEHAEANAIEVPPGESATITWHFTEAGDVLFGCHEPGHYAAGMVGSIDVE